LLELSPRGGEFELRTLLLLDANGVDASPTAGVLELLSDDWLEGDGKRNGVVLLLPLSDIDAAIIITFEVVGFRLLSDEGDALDKSLTMLISVTVA
jgi:hypothetical protein